MRQVKELFFRKGVQCLAILCCLLTLLGCTFLITEKQQKAVPAYASEEGVTDFVSRLYTVILGREADEAGLAEWTGYLQNGTYTGAEVAKGFIMSEEFLGKDMENEEFVQILYQAFFGRKADAAGLETWVNFLDSGYRKSYVFAGFANSTEFGTLCDGYGVAAGSVPVTISEQQPNLSDEDYNVWLFVERMYTEVLKRTPDMSGIKEWVGYLQAGTYTGAEVAAGFILSNEFQATEMTNEEYVQIMYKAFFGREADPSGLETWVNALETEYTKEFVFAGFANSGEFGVLCKTYGIIQGEVDVPEVTPTPTPEPEEPTETPTPTPFPESSYHMVGFNGHSYAFILTEGRTWEEMDEFCQSVGGYFATISSEEEDAFLYDTMHEQGYSNAFFGFIWVDGDWVWNNGEEVVYTNWAEGEPNNIGEELHAMYYFEYEDGKWNNGLPELEGYYTKPTFICEWDYVIEDGKMPEAQPTPTPNPADPQEGDVYFRGHRYRFVPKAKYPTWALMNEYCNSVGGYMASILCAAENEFLYNTMLEKGYVDAYFGFTDEEEEGVWKWVTGEESDYTNWYDPEVGSDIEDYAQFWQELAPGMWNDNIMKETTGVAFICEWGDYGILPSPTPTPIPEDAYVEYGEHRYLFIPEDGRTWEELKEYCEGMGGYLATITTEDENSFLHTTMQEKGFENAFFGYKLMEKDNSWHWANREEKPYENWQGEEPNNLEEPYGMLYVEYTDGKWKNGIYDGEKYEKVAYICEWGDFEYEDLVLKPTDFTYNTVDGYYVCTGLSESGYKKLMYFDSDDTVTIHLPEVSDTDEEVEGFYSDSADGYDLSALMVSTSPYMKLVCPETYLIYRGETGDAKDKIVGVTLNEGMELLYKRAFYNYTGLTEMVLPDSIETYQTEAFSGCTNLVIDTLSTKKVAMGSEVFTGVTINNVIIYESFDAAEPGAGQANRGSFYKANIKNVVFEEGIETIPDDALRHCYALTKITIPDTVELIGKRAFKQCTALVTVNFSEVPEAVTVDKEAFKGCSVLRKTEIFDNITVYGAEAFSGCERLEIDEFNTAGKLIYESAFKKVTIENLIISETFDAIHPDTGWVNDGSFMGAIIEAVSFEEGITTIPEDAFRDASITGVTIPGTVNVIGKRAFYDCTKLEEVILPTSVYEVQAQAFSGCSKLENMEITDFLTTYGTEAFYGCTALHLDSFDTHGKSVVSSAFYGVTIDEVIIRPEFEAIGPGVGQSNKGVFHGATIGTVTFEGEFTAIQADLFRDCYSIVEITIPEDVATIGARAFRSCEGLVTVHLPSSLATIGTEAFKGCTALVEIEVPASVTIGKDAFSGCSSLTVDLGQ